VNAAWAKSSSTFSMEWISPWLSVGFATATSLCVRLTHILFDRENASVHSDVQDLNRTEASPSPVFTRGSPELLMRLQSAFENRRAKALPHSTHSLNASNLALRNPMYSSQLVQQFDADSFCARRRHRRTALIKRKKDFV